MTTIGRVAPPYTEEIAEGVYAYVQPDSGWFLNNCGIILGPDAIIMVDQTSTVDRGRALMETVAKIGGGRSVSGLVNTHHHGDHTFGNFLMPASTSIYAHELARNQVIETGTAVTQFFEGPEWGDIEIRPPDVTFTDRLTIWNGTHQVELMHFGGPAHTTNDVIAYLPNEKVCFAGDLLFNGGMPFALQGSVVGWLKVIDELAQLNVDTWVAGHGPVSAGEEIAVVRAYLQFVQDAARAGLEAGVSPLEASYEMALGEFAELGNNERHVGNMHRAYADLTDPDNLAKPIDLVEAVEDMRTFCGGPIVSLA